VTPAEPVAAILRGAPASVTIMRSPRRPLVAGASTRLLAEIRDLGGQTVPGSRVDWSSTDPGIVRVDSASGRVRAVRPGRALVVAASGSLRDSLAIVVRPATAAPPAATGPITPGDSLRAGDTTPAGAAAVLPSDSSADTLAVQGYESERVAETPKATQAKPAVPPPATPDRGRQRLDAGVLTGVQQCYEALRSKNVARVAELYRPVSKADEDKLNKLTRILRTEEWDAVVGKRVDGPRQLGPAAAAMEFSFPLVWKDAFGGRLASRPSFRAEFAKKGNEWEMSSCRVVGSPKL
jgi:hypothetical protein